LFYLVGAVAGVPAVAVGGGTIIAGAGDSDSAKEERMTLAMESWNSLARLCIFCLSSAAGPQAVTIKVKTKAEKRNLIFIMCVDEEQI
jgi:hypothetical protein